MEGKIISGYTLKRLLGVGGMAEVWYAENKIGKKAAVKILLPNLCADENVKSRFYTEAEIMVRLDHPNIRQVLDYGEIAGRPAIVMEYLEGDDLKARMKRGQRFTDEELQKWWNQLVNALNYTHQQGIVHRDIKPSNIFVDNNGDVKLLDFGIAKVRESISMTQTGAMLGTLMYMSPEQVEDSKHLDYHSDVYSLAVSYVHLLTGKKPYDSDTMSDYAIRKGIVEQELDLSAVPAAWCAFLKPYLAKDPAKRPALREYNTPQKDSSEDTISINDVPFAMIPEPTECKTISETEKKMTITVNGVSFDMIKVEGGTFWMGAHCKKIRKGLFHSEPDTSTPNFDDQAQDIESPVHKVSLSSYYIGETQVTQELWHAVMGNNPSHFQGAQSWGKGLYAQIVINSEKQPVEEVSYDDIVNGFIPKLNSMTGKVFRLPTEAEWEFAARGGNESNGFKYAGSNRIEDVAWYNCKNPHPVRQLRDNELGIYDMNGNVAEWCSDWYDKYGSGSQSNPQGPPIGSYRVIRGGSWFDWARFCRVSYRSWNGPNERSFNTGFRLAIS